MKTFVVLVALASSSVLVPPAPADHIASCGTAADPASILQLDDPTTGRTLYDEERGNPLGIPVALSAFLLGPDANGDGIPEYFGQGSWIYEETNSLTGLQRNDVIVDDTCGHGPDQLRSAYFVSKTGELLTLGLGLGQIGTVAGWIDVYQVSNVRIPCVRLDAEVLGIQQSANPCATLGAQFVEPFELIPGASIPLIIPFTGPLIPVRICNGQMTALTEGVGIVDQAVVVLC